MILLLTVQETLPFKGEIEPRNWAAPWNTHGSPAWKMWQQIPILNDLKRLETHLCNIANYLETVYKYYSSIRY